MPSSKTLHKTNNPYESKFGYARAIRKKDYIFVSGTTSANPDPATSDAAPTVLYPGDAEAQTQTALSEALKAVVGLGGSVFDVVRVRLFVGLEEVTGDVGRGMKEFFEKEGAGREVGFAATMIVVKGGFVNADMLVEVEIDAIVD